jgi:hypothetical protein
MHTQSRNGSIYWHADAAGPVATDESTAAGSGFGHVPNDSIKAIGTAILVLRYLLELTLGSGTPRAPSVWALLSRGMLGPVDRPCKSVPLLSAAA